MKTPSTRQLLQNLRTGELTIRDIPANQRPPKFVTVNTRASLISAGTERSTVQAARASLLGKARQRPDQVRKVIESVRSDGLLATYSKVTQKLAEPKALGYSSAGVVLECDDSETTLRSGTRVACGGGDYAVHGELVTVPRNLVCPLPDAVTFEQGSFATVGAIALQGVRRAEPQYGETTLVIGLGLLGQLTWQLLASAGIRVIGTDVSSWAVELARGIGLQDALVRGVDDVEGECSRITNGKGVDRVLITASAPTSDPLELAGSVSRECGRVVVVGALPINVPREPYYMKELDLVLSRSYGPGRYDPLYEESGIDYPYGRVRWTEGRNIGSFLHAVENGSLDVDSLVTHRFPIDKAGDAYKLVSGEQAEPHCAIVLDYEGTPVENPEQPDSAVPFEPPLQPGSTSHRIGFIGAGSFACKHLLPFLAKRGDVDLVAVATRRGSTSSEVARRFGIRNAVSSWEEVVESNEIDSVVIATRHDLHGMLACEALKRGKNVFVEKPLALTANELDEITSAFQNSGKILQVGYNRRFSSHAIRLKEALARSSGHTHVTYRVNAGPLPPEHWLLDSDIGGGRIIGEACHFIDLIQFLCDASVEQVYASGFDDESTGCWTTVLELDDGSTASLIYQANAPSFLAKEYIEAARGGSGGVIDNWTRSTVSLGRAARGTAKRVADKGFASELEAYLDGVRTGVAPIRLDELVTCSLASLAVVKSRSRRGPVSTSEYLDANL